MITYEQIKQIAVSCGFKLTNETGDDLKPYVYEFARELIALAQQVKPLEVVTSPSGKHAHTQFGTYWFRAYGDEVRMSLPEERNYYGRRYKTETEAIAAANEDYRRRVLGCLVNGGVCNGKT